MTVVTMSKREFSRLQVLLDVQSGRLRIDDAAQLVGLGRRQVFRLLKGVREAGPAGPISKHRGRPSNHRLPAEYRERAMGLVRERYADFGPTLAAEKLADLHGFGISRETLLCFGTVTDDQLRASGADKKPLREIFGGR